LHGIPRTIVSDRDTKFTSNFWRGLFKGFGTNLNFSIAYHPQTDGQIERVNQIIEDMLRMYVMDNPSKWKDYLHLVEFSYNNGYQASSRMCPFESLYGRKFDTLVRWDNPEYRVVHGSELLKDMEDQVVKNLNRSTNIITTNVEYTIDPQSKIEETTLYYYQTLEVGQHHTMDPIMEGILSCSLASSRGQPPNELPLQIQYFSSYLITLLEPLYIVLPSPKNILEEESSRSRTF
jgi:hypothetical protein